MNAVLRYVRQLAAVEGARGREDQELLRRFVERRDEGAFAALVDRHGPLVLGACRRLLGNEQDAEDVLQATFLVFVRKAGSIRRRGSVGSWLYGVARRLALKARAGAARQRAREQAAASAAARRQVVAPPTLEESLQALDEELRHLPEKYRAPILLCCLEGKSRDEAARQLGWAEGAVKIRLERGRELLRARLARRGLPLSAALFPALLAQNAAAALPARLAAGTVEAGLRLAAGQPLAGVASPPVAALAADMLRAMGVARLKAAAVLLLACVAGAGAGAALWAKAPGEPPAPEPPATRADEHAAKVPAPPPPGNSLTSAEEVEEKLPETGSDYGNLQAVDLARRTITVRVKGSDTGWRRTAAEVPSWWKQLAPRRAAPGRISRSVTVRFKEPETVYALPADVRVVIDGKKAALADLRPRADVLVRVYAAPDTDRVICVAADGPSGYYRVRAVDPEGSTLTALGVRDPDVRRTFSVAARARILTAQDKPIRLADLKQGTQVHLQQSYADEQTVIRVKASGQ